MTATYAESSARTRRPLFRRRSALPGFAVTMGVTITILSLIVLIPLTAVALKASQQSPSEFLNAAFNERALMRGTLKDQAEYFAKALGSGGHQPWHTANEIRDLAEYPADPDPKFNTLGDPSGKKASNEPQKAT